MKCFDTHTYDHMIIWSYNHIIIYSYQLNYINPTRVHQGPVACKGTCGPTWQIMQDVIAQRYNVGPAWIYPIKIQMNPASKYILLTQLKSSQSNNINK